jgi:predicted RND superfamily exporter protein
VKGATKTRLEKLESSRRRNSRLEDMTDQQRNARIGVIEQQLGGREKILIELRARAYDDPSVMRFISLLEQREVATTT